MALLVWQDDLNIGIDVIDQQHRRIIEMLNHLHVAQASMQRAAVGEVIDEVVDYTMSHFAFEEELMEEAGYPFCAAHKRVHEVFIKRVSEYRMRFEVARTSATSCAPCSRAGCSTTSVATTRRMPNRSRHT